MTFYRSDRIQRHWREFTEPDERSVEVDNDDDQLRMIFACCHPAFPWEARITLTLHLMCGLTAGEIASAYLTDEATIEQRIFRAKRKLAEERSNFEVLEGVELAARLDSVLAALYLLFNEGYNSPQVANPVRIELCREALRLTTLVSRHPRTDLPKSKALLALICFQCARIPARIGEDGGLLLLAAQDRSRWESGLIERGFEAMDEAARGPELTRYHLEATIASCNCSAASFEETDWERILELYDLLLERQPTPVVRLNRAVALGHARGPAKAVEELARLEREPSLQRYYLLPATLGEFSVKLGEAERARHYFEQARGLTASEAERRLLAEKLEALPPRA